MLSYLEFKAAVKNYGLADTLKIARYFLPIETALLYVSFLTKGELK